jgi:hypothetical protein
VVIDHRRADWAVVAGGKRRAPPGVRNNSDKPGSGC